MSEYQLDNSHIIPNEYSDGNLTISNKNKTETYLSNKEIENLKEKLNIIPELDARILILEQSEQNLKRQKQNLQIEISDLKIQIEKYKMEEEIYDSPIKEINENFPNLTLKEAKEIINELLEEVQEIKKEKNEISEKALNLLTEKELNNMELREQLEELRNNQMNEINNLARKMYFKENESDFNNYSHKDSDTQDLSKSLERNSLIQIPLVNNMKDQSDLNDIISIVEIEKENMRKDFEEEKKLLKITIENMDEKILKLKEEISNKEQDHIDESSINNSNLNKNVIFSEFESLQNTIRFLEEKNIETDQNFKSMINKLKEELRELDKHNKKLKNINDTFEKEIGILKNDYGIKLRNLIDTNKNEILLKEKEIKKLQLRIEEINKEKLLIINEYEVFKKNNEINRENYLKLQENLYSIKDNYENEKREFEEKLITAEKRFETEKNKLIEQLGFIQNKFNQLINTNNPMRRFSGNFLKRRSITIVTQNEDNIFESNNPNSPNNNEHVSTNQSICNNNQYSTLSDCLDEAMNDETPEAVIIELENRIEAYEAQLNELNLKLNLYKKKEKEIDFIKIENSNLKENLERMKNIYEEQITELQKKNLLMNVELLNLRKNNPRMNEVKSMADDKKIETLNENLLKLNNLSIDYQNLKSILIKEREAFENEIKRNEDKLSILKVQFAQICFEKEFNEVKVKRDIKKLKIYIERLKISKGV